MVSAERPVVRARMDDPRANQLIADISSAFTRATAEDLEQVVLEAIARLGEYEGVDSTYACMISGDTVTDSWEWCAPGIGNSSPPKAGDSASVFFSAAYQLLQLGIALPAEDVFAVDLEPHIRERFERMNAHAILIVPVMDGQELVGVVGALVVGRTYAWPVAHVEQWDLLARMLVLAVKRTRYRSELAAVEARMRRIAASVPEALVTVDAAGVITWLSRSCSALAGRPEGELVGSTVWSLLRPEDADGCREVLDVLFGRRPARAAARPHRRRRTQVGGTVRLTARRRHRRGGRGGPVPARRGPP